MDIKTLGFFSVLYPEQVHFLLICFSFYPTLKHNCQGYSCSHTRHDENKLSVLPEAQNTLQREMDEGAWRLPTGSINYIWSLKQRGNAKETYASTSM